MRAGGGGVAPASAWGGGGEGGRAGGKQAVQWPAPRRKRVGPGAGKAAVSHRSGGTGVATSGATPYPIR